MNALKDQTTVLRDALTLLVPTPVPATVDSHWQLMDDPALLIQQLHLPQLHHPQLHLPQHHLPQLHHRTMVSVEAD